MKIVGLTECGTRQTTWFPRQRTGRSSSQPMSLSHQTRHKVGVQRISRWSLHYQNINNIRNREHIISPAQKIDVKSQYDFDLKSQLDVGNLTNTKNRYWVISHWSRRSLSVTVSCIGDKVREFVVLFSSHQMFILIIWFSLRMMVMWNTLTTITEHSDQKTALQWIGCILLSSFFPVPLHNAPAVN